MAIFDQDKETLGPGNTIGGQNKSDKMKEVVQNLKEGKIGAQEVFYAVDN